MLSQTAHLDNNIAKYHHDEYSPHPFTMDKVLAIGTSFITSLTPQSKRRRTLTPHLADTSTPTTSLHPYSYPTSEPHNSRAVHAAKTDTHHKYLSPSNANFSRQKPETQTPRKRRRSDSHGIEDYVESENSSAIGPDDSASNIARYNDDEDTILTAPDSERGHRIGNGYKRKKQRVATYSSSESNADVDDGVDDGNEEELVTEESEVDSINLAPEDEEAIAEEANPNEDISREELFARRKSNIEEARAAGWHEDEIVVYAKLTMRGFEPLMSKYWWKDFRTCPSSLFSDAKEDWVISSQSGNEYRGIKALTSLTTLGGRVRDALLFRKSPEMVMKKEYDACIKWSEADGGYRNMRFIPLLVNLAVDRSQPVDRISKSIIDQMNYLAVRYRQFYTLPDADGKVIKKKLPLIYGIVAVGATTVFVTMDAAATDSTPRTIAEFDFSDAEMDVWNGIAMMMIICFARDKLVAIKGDMEDDEVDDDDPDA